MIKRSLFFGNPYHLSTELGQLIITNKKTGAINQAPIEDLGFVVFEHREITFTMGVLNALAKNNTAVVICNEKHMPASMLFHLDTHQVQNERFRAQVSSKEPLKKQLWQQTVKAKIKNQAAVLKWKGEDDEALKHLAREVKSGDSTNIEAMASRRYWPRLMGKAFRRERFGMPPNPSLNYGYSIVRAAVARALSGSGLLPTLGIHHHNKYNAFCLADDIMEPYRPFMDSCVFEQMALYPDYHHLNTERKAELIRVLSSDVRIEGRTRPFMVALSETTASLARCFEGKTKKIRYPEFTES